MAQDIVVERDGAITRVVLNRPSRLNSLNADIVDALLEAVARAGEDGTRLLVLEGAGKGFSGGFDFGGLEAGSEGDLVLRFIRIEMLLQAVQHAPYTTLALVHGACFGAAADLVAACVHRVASADARFRMPGLKFGVVLGTRRLAALVGTDAARGLLQTSRVFAASEALQIGFLTGITEREAWPAAIADAAAKAASLSVVAGETLLRLTVPDTRAQDLAELARSVAMPGLKARMLAYLADMQKASAKAN